MSAPVPPRRFADVAQLSDTELYLRYIAHRDAMLEGRPRLGDPATARAVFDHAVGALICMHMTRSYSGARALLVMRCPTVRIALAADAGRALEVAAACDLAPDELAAELRRWTAEQHRYGLMSDLELGVMMLHTRGLEAGGA